VNRTSGPDFWWLMKTTAHGAGGVHPEPGQHRTLKKVPSSTMRTQFRLLRVRAGRRDRLSDAKEVLLGLFDADAERAPPHAEGGKYVIWQARRCFQATRNDARYGRVSAIAREDLNGCILTQHDGHAGAP
jgi:hypothetical protein